MLLNNKKYIINKMYKNKSRKLVLLILIFYFLFIINEWSNKYARTIKETI